MYCWCSNKSKPLTSRYFQRFCTKNTQHEFYDCDKLLKVVGFFKTEWPIDGPMNGQQVLTCQFLHFDTRTQVASTKRVTSGASFKLSKK